MAHTSDGNIGDGISNEWGVAGSSRETCTRSSSGVVRQPRAQGTDKPPPGLLNKHEAAVTQSVDHASLVDKPEEGKMVATKRKEDLDNLENKEGDGSEGCLLQD